MIALKHLLKPIGSGSSLAHLRYCSMMASRLQGKVAIVTASSEGIGYEIARRLAKEGAKVVISSRKIANVDKAVATLKSENLDVIGVKCHVGNAEDRKELITKAVETYGGIDILVSNAAVNPEVATVMESSESAWDKIFEINVKCSYLIAKEVLPYIRKRGPGGNIVFISSIAGFQTMSLLGVYSVSKTALFGLTKAAAAELAPEGIRVNCLAPGIIKTKFSEVLYTSETAKEAALSTIPLGRLGEPEDMAACVAFMVSNDAAFLTGEIICATGGATSRL